MKAWLEKRLSGLKNSRVAQSPFWFHNLERFKFRKDDIIIATLWQVWNNVDAANRGAASIQWTRRSWSGWDVTMARFASVPEGCEACWIGGANTPSLPQNASAGRCIGVFRKPSTSTLDGMDVDVGAYITITRMPIRCGMSCWMKLRDSGPTIGKPPESIRVALSWLAWEGRIPLWSLWENVRSWWKIQHLPNVLLVHYAKLKQDLPGQMQRIAEFLAIPLMRWSGMLFLSTVALITWSSMRPKAFHSAVVLFGAAAQTFIYMGTNGRWREWVDRRGKPKYEQIAKKQLGKRVHIG